MLHVEYDENEHSKECYAHFGLSIYYAQVLEHQLVNMIVVLKLSQGLLPCENDLDTIYERKFSKTMGHLINEIKQLFLLQTEEVDELKEILRLRNFIVHEYFKEKITLTFSRSGKDEMINELKEFVERVQALDEKLVVYSNELHEKIGITQEMIQAELIKVKEEIRFNEL
ncbi:hypothetical protein AB4Z17_29370 [Paenibacillus sp. TAF43_2]|uniref:hypothetical protein n=1 Tax=Paenibacillus sp. TAF43_2 TaxID=3233069 RepID=UPI003F9438D9